jgi:hypothetical protein
MFAVSLLSDVSDDASLEAVAVAVLPINTSVVQLTSVIAASIVTENDAPGASSL